MTKEKPSQKGSAGGLGRLPPGRHGLPREVVAENQHERLIAAAIATFGEHGYNETTINKILEAAGVSTRTFYEHFSGKEDCFLSAYKAVIDYFAEAIAAAGGEAMPWPGRVRARLRVLLEAFAANPALARFMFVAPTTAGGAVADRQRRFGPELLSMLLAEHPDPAESFTDATEQALVGGMIALIVDQVEMGASKSMEQVLPQLLALLLTPYVGRDQALQFSELQG